MAAPQTLGHLRCTAGEGGPRRRPASTRAIFLPERLVRLHPRGLLGQSKGKLFEPVCVCHNNSCQVKPPYLHPASARPRHITVPLGALSHTRIHTWLQFLARLRCDESMHGTTQNAHVASRVTFWLRS